MWRFHTYIVTQSIVERVIEELADLYISLASHPLESIGSLYPRPAEMAGVESVVPPSAAVAAGQRTSIVGPLVTSSFCLTAPPHYLGPFRTTADRWIALIDLVLDGIRDGTAFTDEDELRFLLHWWIRNFVVHHEAFHRVEPTYLKHADDKGDHILLDLQGNFTGLLDWEW